LDSRFDYLKDSLIISRFFDNNSPIINSKCQCNGIQQHDPSYHYVQFHDQLNITETQKKWLDSLDHRAKKITSSRKKKRHHNRKHVSTDVVSLRNVYLTIASTKHFTNTSRWQTTW